MKPSEFGKGFHFFDVTLIVPNGRHSLGRVNKLRVVELSESQRSPSAPQATHCVFYYDTGVMRCLEGKAVLKDDHTLLLDVGAGKYYQFKKLSRPASL